MAERPAFFIGDGLNGEFVRKEEFNFNWHHGFSFSQKQKNVKELHEAIYKKYPNYKVLEISSKSNESFGRKLSAFKLTFKHNEKFIYVESAFQGSKVFENGGPYTELLSKPSIEAKKDTRLRTSGQLKTFRFDNKDWELTPTTSFYDWLYLNALTEKHNAELAKFILEFDCFTDIEFNPQKSFNCQARAAALYKYLVNKNLLDDTLASEEKYLKRVRSESKKNMDVKKVPEKKPLLTCFTQEKP